MASVSNVSGGVSIDSQQVTIGNDVVGRDKIVQATTYIEHATIIQSAPLAETPMLSLDAPVWECVEFVRIPSGEFLMGSRADNSLASDSEKPQHPIELAYDYWIGRYPVTNEQFARFVAAAQYPFDLGQWQTRADYPVVKVSWLDALAYCKWLKTLARASFPSQGLVLRLPTEAEWEKAARGSLSPVVDGGDLEGVLRMRASANGRGVLNSIRPNATQWKAAKKAPRRSALIRRRATVPLASRTWRAMCGSGPSACGDWITSTRSIVIRISRTTGAKNSMRLPRSIAWCAAARSTLDRAACVLRPATGSIRACGMKASAFAWWLRRGSRRRDGHK